MASGKDKDALNLYDGDDDLLDYGDDLDVDLLDGDLAGVGAYDDLELGAEDDLGLDLPPLDAASSSTSKKADDQNNTVSNMDDSAYDETVYTETDASAVESSGSKTNNQSTSNDDKRDASPSAATTSQKRQSYDDQSEVELGGNNRHSSKPSNDRSPYYNDNSSSSSSSPRGGGRGAGLRGRGNQGYGTSSGRGNYQGGGAGRGGHMMGMGMTQQQMYAMQQMGMNMNMGLGMGMGVNGARFSGSDGYGNQGMGYPYNGGASTGGGAGTPGRTIHINPKFQNRAGVPTVPGATTAATASVPEGLDRALGQQQQQGSRQFHQDSGNGQSPGRGNQSSRSGSQDRFDGDQRYNRNQQYNNNNNNRRSDSRDGRDQISSGSDRGGRTDNSYHSSASAERDFGQGLSTNRDFGGRSGDSPRSSQPHSPMPSYNNRSSPIIGGGSPGSISSRLTSGLKRAGGGPTEDSQKAQKSSGSSTPRGEHSRSSTNQEYGSDTGSVSFLRGRQDGGGEDSPQHRERESSSSNSNAVPTGYVKVDNIPNSVSEASIRQLAQGISGVDRVLTVSKKGDRAVVLGFASIDEAKFFRRQINRTSIDGSLVTVTLTSA
ncbi:hypothetical protein BGZ96_005951 [Linnemannia gamsii]|uniref:RRM domain-containing protein n=1 Tax=Linnemannia gamsii TaxID=64522 RepID=A0ABQ7K488_9FUNG|nr:hypothetical protein BGZ96_005951 [Linnemannia gamsii]